MFAIHGTYTIKKIPLLANPITISAHFSSDEDFKFMLF
jgi:hypothetical protein